MKKKGTRVLIICFAILFLFIGLFITNKSLLITPKHTINYKESSDLDYRVYLKENNEYDVPFLGKDMAYVSSLVKSIKTSYSYKFDISEASDILFTYDIVARLTIYQNGKKAKYFEKEYTLLDDQKYTMLNTRDATISKEIDIDYNYYNNIASSYENKYGVNSVSELYVYMKINKSNPTNEINNLVKDDSTFGITIPLSTRTINISLSTDKLNNKDNVIAKEKVEIKNITLFVVGCEVLFISLLLFIFYIIKLVKKHNNMTDHDKEINKLMKEYDRLIVETSNKPVVDNVKVQHIETFGELLDVRDTLKKPILHYVEIEHIKSYFYVIQKNVLYIYEINDNKD